MSTFAYTREELVKIGDAEFPRKGVLCPRCRTYIPKFSELSHEQEESIRQLDSLEQMKAIREVTGCPPRWAKIWVLHPNGPEEPQKKSGPPCPYCDELLFTNDTKQCLECGWDWHDAAHPIQRIVRKKTRQ